MDVTRLSRRLMAPLVVVLLSVLSGCEVVQPPLAQDLVAPVTGAPAPDTRPLAPPLSPELARAPSPTAVTACSNPAALASWTTTRLAEQTVVVPVDEGNVRSITPEIAAGAGGVILFGTHAPATLGQQLAALNAAAPGGVPPFVMTDEEGGDVQRMANLVGSVPSARVMGATMSAVDIRSLAARLGGRMRAAGVSMDLAPVLDVDGGVGPNTRNPDGTRSFSANPAIAARDGLAFAAGLGDGGVVAVLKHFPGLGGATGNTDAMAASTRPWSALQHSGLLPFEAAVTDSTAAVMVSNAIVPGLTRVPASVSPVAVTTILRERLGYQGLVMTDSLTATALTAAGYPLPAAAVAAIRAGVDMVLYSARAATVAAVTNRVVSALVAAVAGGMLQRSRLVSAASHILAAKKIDLCG